MNAEPKAKRTYSVDSMERMRAAAQARYDNVAENNHERVRAMMKSIQLEMAGNAGIYPSNKGAISMAEVARRSQIHPFTFHKPRYEALGKEVKVWLETLKQGSIVGRGPARKESGVRAQEWKRDYEGVLGNLQICRTDLLYSHAECNEFQLKYEESQRRLAEALLEIERLRKKLAGPKSLKVVPIRPIKAD
jgi:hypothetical protein